MSLQDIKQILSRIIVLNKNLDENRLNNLLEAGGWEKQNKEEALSIFKIEKKKNILEAKEDAKQIANNLTQEINKELSTEVTDQELSIVDNKELSADIKKDDVINFIPNNLPIKEEVEQEVIPSEDKVLEIAEVINIVPEKIIEKSKGINWAVWLSIALIIFLLAFGYMASN